MRSHVISTASLQKALASNLGSGGSGTNRKKEFNRRKSSRKSDSSTISGTKQDSSTSQWYTGPPDVVTIPCNNTAVSTVSTPMISSLATVSSPTLPIIELRQELTPSRPLRSEAEKERRISSRWSIQSQPYAFSNSSGNIGGSSEQVYINDTLKMNRDSLDTVSDNTITTITSDEDPPPPLPIKMRESDSCHFSSLIAIDNDLNKLSISLNDDNFEISTKPPTPPPKPKRPKHISKLLPLD